MTCMTLLVRVHSYSSLAGVDHPAPGPNRPKRITPAARVVAPGAAGIIDIIVRHGVLEEHAWLTLAVAMENALSASSEEIQDDWTGPVCLENWWS